MRNSLIIVGSLAALSAAWAMPPEGGGQATAPPALDGAAEVLWQTDFPGAYPVAVAVSAYGGTVFVAGAAPQGRWLREDCLALALGAQSGGLRWAERCNDSGCGDRIIQGMVPSPDDDALYLTGTCRTRRPEIETLALAAGHGMPLWSVEEGREAAGIAVDPEGRRVYVTGSAAGPVLGSRVLYTVARDARTGTLLWRSSTALLDNAAGIALIPSQDGGALYVLAAAADRFGTKIGRLTKHDSASGAVLWMARLGESGEDFRVGSMVMSPQRDKLFVSGRFAGPGTDTAVVRAIEGENGNTLWMRSRPGDPEPWTMAVSADGTALFLGYGDDAPDAGLEALDTATGAVLWAAAGRGVNGVRDIAVSGRLDRVAVLAEQGLSVAVLDAHSGSSIWSARYSAEGRPADLAFDPAGTTLFVPSRCERDGGLQIRVTAFQESRPFGESVTRHPPPDTSAPTVPGEGT